MAKLIIKVLLGLFIIIGLLICGNRLITNQSEVEWKVDTDTIYTQYGIRIVNKESTHNPTWDELKTFILSDNTDRLEYIDDIRVCKEFASQVHNNAENAGMKAGVVIIDFQNDPIGHVCNVFNTTDKGLVYIDCTGAGLERPEIFYVIGTGQRIEKYRAHDDVAYIVVGQEYVCIDINKATSFEYDFYRNLKQQLDEYQDIVKAYNERVDKFNDTYNYINDWRSWRYGWTPERYFYGDPGGWDEFKKTSDALDKDGDKLRKMGAIFPERWIEPLGIVQSTKTYW